MSRVRQVLQNKNKVQKISQNRRKEEMESIKSTTAFKARLYDELKRVDVLLDKDEIEAVEIVVPSNFLAKFSAAIYAEDLAEYDIQQSEESPDHFYVRRKFIAF